MNPPVDPPFVARRSIVGVKVQQLAKHTVCITFIVLCTNGSGILRHNLGLCCSYLYVASSLSDECIMWPKPFGVKCRMVSFPLLDTIRELRYWFSGGNSCPWGILILVGLVIGCSCCIFGFILGAVAFSSKIRHFAAQVLQLFLSLWCPVAPPVISNTQRLAEYRRSQ